MNNPIKISVFTYEDPIAFLRDWIRLHKPYRSGLKKNIAAKINCQPSFVTQLLAGKSQLSLEQAFSLGEFLELDESETEYFNTLTLRARSGTYSLTRYLEQRLKKLKDQSLNLKEKIFDQKPIHELSETSIRQYFSSWHYPFVHLIYGVDDKISISDLSTRAQIPTSRIQSVVRFLFETGCLLNEGGKVKVMPFFHHLERGSEQLIPHLKNGLSFLNSRLDEIHAEDIHYNLYASLDEETAFKIKTLLNECISRSAKLTREAKNEAIFNFQCHFLKMT